MKRIRFKHRRNRGAYGMAYPDQHRIEIDPKLDERLEMEIGLHEGLHVLFPWMAEEIVDHSAKVLADLLWRLGYRKKDED